ncbi:nucleoside deaminase [Labrenzia sp. PHM005]|uniref:nucleoside deaminase n=1 Tax=Labrenzia sp. PHM005 TaxID=2590016 RepID=UPI0011402D52|nr:nucleoside deaminase [Labrenzia sp. PHM005]QDG79162.1 nucleoside deaminase [Labrenzia sp. PHM005]
MTTDPAQTLEKTYMDLALEEAEKAAVRGEVPVGAVLVQNGKILARDGNRTLELNDPTAHAEVLVIRSACEHLQSQRLPECDLYVTLEPCAMCAAAISFARIRRLYYGAADEKGGAVDHGPRFFCQPTCHHGPETYAGIGERQSAALLKSFFQGRR